MFRGGFSIQDNGVSLRLPFFYSHVPLVCRDIGKTPVAADEGAGVPGPQVGMGISDVAKDTVPIGELPPAELTHQVNMRRGQVKRKTRRFRRHYHQTRQIEKLRSAQNER